MRRVPRGCWLVLGLALWVPAMAVAADDPPPILLSRPEAELFRDAPAPWREYLLAARRAEAIEDALQRCLAYPDLPGNQWPAGHAEAHCKSHAQTFLSADALNALLDAGQYDDVERRLDALLQRHFSTSDFSEEIDYAFDGFKRTSPQTDARTLAWLQQRPNSPYAHLARGMYLLAAGADARGSAFIQNTPANRIREMERLLAQAVPELEAATRLQPRLMPAYAELVLAAMYDSSVADAQAAVTAAGRQDPACQTLFMRRMDALRPQWGGSLEAMLTLAAEVQRYVAERPQLAIYVGQPYAERGLALMREDDFGREAVELLEIAVRKGSREDALSDAANALLNAHDDSRDPWKALAYLLQESRFKDGGRWEDVNISRMLLREEPALAWRYAQRVLAWKPDDSAANFYFAGANFNLGRIEVADRHLRIAIRDPDYVEDGLDALISMWLFRAGLSRPQAAAKVKPDLDRMLREFPDSGRALMYRIVSGLHEGGRIRAEWIKEFLDRMNPEDPKQAEFKRKLDAWMAENPGLRDTVNRARAAPRH